MDASSALRVLARVGMATVVPVVAAAGVTLGPEAASAAPTGGAVTSQAATASPGWAQWRLRAWYADPVGCSAAGQAYMRGGVISYRCVYLSSPPYKMLPWELDLLY